jgi:hypothetical protein
LSFVFFHSMIKSYNRFTFFAASSVRTKISLHVIYRLSYTAQQTRSLYVKKPNSKCCIRK